MYMYNMNEIEIAQQSNNLNPNPLQNSFEHNYNIWTVRITHPVTDAFDKALKCLFEDASGRAQIKNFLCFHEISKRKTSHYHIRIVTTYKTQNMLRLWIKSFFPPASQGNRFFSTHKVWINGVLYDKSLCHSSTYIAKEGHVVWYYGYTSQQIRELITQSKQYNKMLKMPVYEKIIQLYDVDEPRKIAHAVMSFYDSINKIPPKSHIIQEMIRKMLFQISWKYRLRYKSEMEEFVRELSNEV